MRLRQFRYDTIQFLQFHYFAGAQFQLKLQELNYRHALEDVPQYQAINQVVGSSPRMVLRLLDLTFVFFHENDDLKLLISKNQQNTVNGSTQIVLTMDGLKELQEFILHPIGIALREWAESHRSATSDKQRSSHLKLVHWRTGVSAWFVKDNQGTIKSRATRRASNEGPVVRCRIFVGDNFVGLKPLALAKLMSMTVDFVSDMRQYLAPV